MARIAGVDVPNNKKIEIGLTYIFGIGRSTARKIIDVTGVDENKRIGDLTQQEISEIRKFIDENLKVEGDLRKDVSLNIKRLMEINCYRGQRHKNSLPCRGQKTRSNARTRRGLAGKRGIKKK
ncbi:30S ribosomal protein S13 [Deferribacteraceae bacterium V6Fe1]|uniref:30S ribosomal protein S13 n=1 Tax=Deferrivibrio essentukiensis TaxID=2880922 RepID=UPI0019BAC1B7|nr:30S ribosomal protein S13 [Deferribacterales bacterium]MBZ4672541.1 rpsM [Deferribacteraceae bacterium]MCB4205100.1 30S ribosomal protein S13 [Deferrivibrio essentukiensis]UOD33781.1 30S ribosomal protein S13 [Deferribacteraceae bacterium V6Fe1]